MTRLLPLLALCSIAAPVPAADPPPPRAEKYLHDGKFAQGETASMLALDANPADDEVRFGLGMIQFARAVENLGRAMHEYGAAAENTNVPFLRLPVPKNDRPSAISYRALGRVLDAFAADLGRAEATLAAVKDDKVALRLRLAKVTFDFTGTGSDPITLVEVLTRLNGRRFDFLRKNPDFVVRFDRGDVAWVRAYCHLLSAMVEGYRAVDEETGFEERVRGIFPKVEAGRKPFDAGDRLGGLRVVDAPRLRRARLHLTAVCELNRETWRHILAETDDDHEWLPNPRQKDQLGLPITERQIDAWLAMMAELEGFLKGERLLGSQWLRFVHGEHELGMGLNLKKLLDDPPADLLSDTRLREKGIDARYLEPENRWIRHGCPALNGERVRLEATRVGGRWLIAEEDLEAFFRALGRTEPPVSLPAKLRTPEERRKVAERASRELSRRGA